jgi:hypothetical protein
MSETGFQVVFDGPGVDDGRRPVRDFAPALLALGDLFVEASAIVHPKVPPAALKVKATERGSFAIDLILEAPKAWDEIVSLLNSGPANAVINFRELIVGSAGLYWLIKKANEKRIKNREAPVDPAMIRIAFEDGTVIEVPSDLLRLYDNLRIRQRVQETVEPIGREGVDNLKFRAGKQAAVEISRDDLPAYQAPEVEEKLLQHRDTEMILSIASVVFTEGNKWRFSDGQHTFAAAIEDRDFIERVNSGSESFRSGDMLRCKVLVDQTLRGDLLHTEYTVTEVEQRIPRIEQLDLRQPEPAPPQLPPAREDLA